MEKIFKSIKLVLAYFTGHKMRVAAAIIEKDGKILIAERKRGGRLGGLWEFPGGKIEPGETPEECLKRELKEEFSIVTEIGEFFVSTRFTYQFVPLELLVYKANHVSGEFILTDHDRIEWVTPSQLKDFAFVPADRAVVQRIQGTGYRG